MTTTSARASLAIVPGVGSKVCTSAPAGTRLVTSTSGPPTLRTRSANTVLLATTSSAGAAVPDAPAARAARRRRRARGRPRRRRTARRAGGETESHDEPDDTRSQHDDVGARREPTRPAGVPDPSTRSMEARSCSPVAAPRSALLPGLVLAFAWLLVPAAAVAGDPCYHDFELPARDGRAGEPGPARPVRVRADDRAVPVGATVTFAQRPRLHAPGHRRQPGVGRPRHRDPRRPSKVSYTFDKAGDLPVRVRAPPRDVRASIVGGANRRGRARGAGGIDDRAAGWRRRPRRPRSSRRDRWPPAIAGVRCWSWPARVGARHAGDAGSRSSPSPTRGRPSPPLPLTAAARRSTIA